LKQIFLEEGITSILITDNGTQLTSNEMQKFLSLLGITHRRTALHNSQASGI
ncbi:hypothetical protein NDU88_003026, partial [Pleurodeles waltl]